MLDLQPSVDHEQWMAAHLEGSPHHWGPEHQVEMGMLVGQGEEPETSSRRRLLPRDHQARNADPRAVQQVAHLLERDAAEGIELGAHE